MSEIKENINSTNLVLQKGGKKFYRYDVGDPPDTWSTDYKSREYQHEGHGNKNKIGAFFFYGNIEDCKRAAQNALAKCTNTPSTFTECQLTEDVRILDLRQAHIRNIIDALYFEGIDVLRGDFFNHYNQKTYLEVRKTYRNMDNSDWMKSFKLAKQLLGFWGELAEPGGNYGYFGQQLTDFDNGFIIKQLLEEKVLQVIAFMKEDVAQKEKKRLRTVSFPHFV